MFNSNDSSQPWNEKRILILVALATLIISVIWRLPEEAAFFGHRTAELLLALTLALATTYVLRPGVRFLVSMPGFGDTEKGRTKATLAVFVACGFLLYLMFLVGFKPVARDVRELVPASSEERTALVQQWRESARTALEPYQDFIPANVLDDPKFFSSQAGTIARSSADWLKKQSAHAGFLVELLLVPVLAFYFLADGPAIRREARLLVPEPWRPRLARMASHFDYVLDGYVRGQAWMCIIAWILTTVVLMILRVPHATTLGLVAGLTRAVPVIGPILGAIPLLFVTLFYTRSVQTTSILLTAFFMMHFLESKVLLPKVVGHHVDLHPVSVILSLLIGMEFFGFIGVFLAVPIAAVLKILLIEYHLAQRNKRLLTGQEVAPASLEDGSPEVVLDPAASPLPSPSGAMPSAQTHGTH